jgi:hypothetical protein
MSAIKVSLSLHGSYPVYLRIADAQVAVPSAVADEKTSHATLGTGSSRVTTETNRVTIETNV